MKNALSATKRWLEQIVLDFGEKVAEEEIDQALNELAGGQAHAHDRSLYDHLKGTREILAAWSQPLWIQLGGLFHSVYSTESYANEVLPLDKRHQLRCAIGKRAERLAYLFAASSRRELVDGISQTGPRTTGRMVISDRFTGKENPLSREELFALRVLIMANQAEQSCTPDRGPGRWLAYVSRIGRQLRRADGELPKVFNSCLVEVTEETERHVIASYREALGALNKDEREAVTAFSVCEEMCPWIAEPLIWKAYIELRQHNPRSAEALARRADERLANWGTAWDKRLSFAEWKRIAGVFREPDRHVGREIGCVDNPAALLGCFDIPRLQVAGPAQGKPPSSDADRIESYLAGFASGRRMNAYPLKQGPPWYEPSEFPITRALEASFSTILAEISRFGENNFHAEGEKISRTGAWDVCMLYERGRKNAENCLQCPTIAQIIEEHETVRTLAGLMYVSRLAPSTRIAPHRGPTNIRVRCHLGIKIPNGDCCLRVRGETRRWEQGRCIVFDDFHEHEVWNNTSEERIVLIIDLWHPQLSERERKLLAGLHRYAALQAEGLQKYWSINENLRTQKRREYD